VGQSCTELPKQGEAVGDPQGLLNLVTLDESGQGDSNMAGTLPVCHREGSRDWWNRNSP